MVSWDTRMLSSSGYGVFSHPEICSGDQSRISLLATMSRNLRFTASRHLFGRKAETQAWRSASWARLAGPPPWRATSRLTVEAARSRRLAISRIDEPEAIPREISSRSASVSASRERRRATGGMPPRGSNTARIELCGLPYARPISCSVCPAFQRLQTSRFSIEESPNRIPDLMPTLPLQSRFTSDGVASTYRMHRSFQEIAGAEAQREDSASLGAPTHPNTKPP